MGRPTKQEIDDIRNEGKQDKAYMGSMTTTESDPVSAPSTPSVPKPIRRRPPAMEEALQEVQDGKDRKKISDMGYKKGGSVRGWGKARGGRAAKVC